MVRRRDQHVRVGPQRKRLHRHVPRRTPGEGDLHLAAAQGFDGRVAIADQKAQIDLRPRLDEGRDQPGSEIFRRRHRADGKPAALPGAERAPWRRRNRAPPARRRARLRAPLRLPWSGAFRSPSDRTASATASSRPFTRAVSAAGVMLSAAAAWTSEPAAAIACRVSICRSDRLRIGGPYSIFLNGDPKLNQFSFVCKYSYKLIAIARAALEAARAREGHS